MDTTSLEHRVAALEHDLATLQAAYAMVTSSLLIGFRAQVGDDRARAWHAEVSRIVAARGLSPEAEALVTAMLATLVAPRPPKP